MPGITAPQDFFGFRLGEDRRIAAWDKIVAYFDYLAKNSDRIQVQTVGPTTEGHPFLLVIVSSPQNLARLEELRQVNLRLSDPKGLGEDDLTQLIKKGKAVVCQSMSLHANEIGGTQMAPELAYDLLTRTDEETLRILENVIFLMVPCFNPDGQMMVVEWYQRWLETEYEGSELPWLYHKYAGHDNNRDSFQANLVESQYVNQILFVDWIPQAYIDHHQFGSYGARFYVPPYCEPIHPYADPLVWREHAWWGGHIAYKLEEAGKSGVLNGAQFPAWGHLGFHRIAMYHNIAGMLTESASVNLASPIYIKPDQLTGDDRGWLRHYAPQLNFPHPWPGGWWRLRELVEQQKICAWSALDIAARNKETTLRTAVLKARHQTEVVQSETTNAYVVPVDQHDGLTMHKMIAKLLGQGIKIHYALKDINAGGGTIKRGSYVIWLDQPKSGLLRTLFERTFYPDNPWTRTEAGVPISPWDMTTDTMAEFMGVCVGRANIQDRSGFERVSAPCLPEGGVLPGSQGSDYAIDPRLNASFAFVNELLAQGVPVHRATEPIQGSGKVYPPGAFIFRDEKGLDLERLARKHHIFLAPVQVGDVGTRVVNRLRIGLFQRYWGGNADEGWTRLVLEQFQFPYKTIRVDDIRDGRLRDRVDVLVIPNDSTQLITGENINQWWEKKIAQKPLVPFPPEYCQPLGEAGINHIRDFIIHGGRLVALGGACDFVIEKLGLPLVNSIRDADSKTFYCPGSTLRATINTNHPLGYGMQASAHLVLTGNVGLEASPETNAHPEVVARYADQEVLQSGLLIGEEMIRSKAAILTMPYGQGDIMLAGCRVQNRAQTDGSYKLLFNALYRLGCA